VPNIHNLPNGKGRDGRLVWCEYLQSIRQVFRLVSLSPTFPVKPVVQYGEKLNKTYGGGTAPDLNGIPY
jgi:hypothetical protein